MILERILGERYSRVLPLWKDCTVAILGGGPSLTPDQFEIVRAARQADRVRVIAINDSYLLAPWADVHYAADAKWHKWHMGGVDKPALGLSASEVRERWAAFVGQKSSIQGAGELPEEVHILRNARHPVSDGAEISDDPKSLFPGRHGGFQTLNMAILAGSKDVLLLGFDAQRAACGKRHWHGDHPLEVETNDKYAHMRKAFSLVENDLVARGIRVVNCSLESAIGSFPKMTFEDALGVTA